MGIDHSCGMELHACVASAWPRVGVDHVAPDEGRRRSRNPWHTRNRHAARAAPGRLYDRNRLQTRDPPPCRVDHLMEHLGPALMRSFTATFAVEAPPRKVWRVLHPPPPPGSTLPRIIEYPAGR